MRVFAVILLIIIALLQFRLWFSADGVGEARRLRAAVETQAQENAQLRARNERLAAEVKDLKEGLAAVEERARSDLGMIGSNETFYQVVPAGAPQPATGGATTASVATRQAAKK